MVRYIAIIWLAFLIFFSWGFATAHYHIFPWSGISTMIKEIELAMKGDDEGAKLDFKTATLSGFLKKPLKHMKQKSASAEEALSGYAKMGHFPESLTGKCIKVATSHQDSLAVLLIGDKSKILHHWDVNYDHTFGTEGEDSESDINGSLILPDGSVIVNYAGYKGIARFDADGKVIWKNDELLTHHSITQTMSNSIWVPGREILEETRLGQKKGRQEDVLYEFDIATGKLRRKIYTVDIFFKNSIHGLYEPIISEDKIHLNDIEEVGVEFANALKKLGVEPTDIIMAGKRMNVVIIVDPDTLETKYIRHYPWNQPHDPDPQSDGSFLLFDNNQAKGEPKKRWGPSRILSIWPATNKVEVYFTADWFYSETRSDQERFNNQLMITSDNEAYLVNIENGKPNYWYINKAIEGKNWFVEDARWIDPSFFTNPVLQAKCSNETLL